MGSQEKNAGISLNQSEPRNILVFPETGRHTAKNVDLAAAQLLIHPICLIPHDLQRDLGIFRFETLYRYYTVFFAHFKAGGRKSRRICVAAACFSWRFAVR